MIEGLDNVEGLPPGSFAIFSKVHHAAVDGVSGVEVETFMHDLEPDVPAPEPGAEWSPEPIPTPWELLTRAQFNQAMMPMRFAETVGRSFAAFAAAGQPAGFAPPFPASNPTVPDTRINAAISPHRVVEGRRLSLDAIRRVKESVSGATVNDVVLTIVEEPSAPTWNRRASCPRNRSSPWRRCPSGRSARVRRATSSPRCSCRSARTSRTRSTPTRHAARDERTERMLGAINAPNLVELSTFLPGGLSGASQRLAGEVDFANPRQQVYNTVVTNIPGSQVPMYFCGARLVERWGFGPLTDNTGFFPLGAELLRHGVPRWGRVPRDPARPRVLCGVPAGVLRVARRRDDEASAGQAHGERAAAHELTEGRCPSSHGLRSPHHQQRLGAIAGWTLLAMEGRSILEFSAFVWSLPMLEMMPARGDGHAVLVIHPSAVCSDYTQPLRWLHARMDRT